MLTYILLTDRCNLMCNHCIRGSRDAVDMPIDDFKYVCEEVKHEFPRSGLVITGGEPTIHGEATSILDYALNFTKHDVILNSNGTTKFFDHIGDFSRFENLHVQFSIDGLSSYHDRIRGMGSFDKVKHSISALKNANMNLWVSTVVTAENLSGISNLRDYLVDVGVEKWHINPVLPFGCSKGNKTIPVTRWNALVDYLIDTTPIRLGIKKLFDFSALDKMDEASLKQLEQKVAEGSFYNCGCGNRKLYVYPDLSVCGCTCVRDVSFGSLRKMSLRDVLDSANAKIIRNYSIAGDSPCRKCRYVRVCNGGCVGMSYHGFGRLGVGDVRCPIFMRLSR